MDTMTKTRLKTTAIASWSGGKDSCLAYYKSLKAGYRVSCLLNFISSGSKRGCFHGLEGKLLQLQAELIGVPLVQKEVSPDMQKYEEEFKSAVNEFLPQGVTSMVFGDIYLLDHQSWVERVCKEIGIQAVEPLWEIPTEDLIKEFLDLGFKAVIVSAKADIMGKEYIGREINLPLVEELKKKGICPCGENGEYHTLVIDGPIFKRKLKIVKASPLLKEGFWKHWFLDIKEYTSSEK
ncbi:MAG: diphthine--ammonia ligase [Candidatus Omnitrophota bacterium]